ncbi:MAG: L,D-transpeptidase [Candidatus Saccharimonadales bacterium]
MTFSSLDRKTIRPGSLNGYAYYYSKRRPPKSSQKAPARKHGRSMAMLAVLVLILLAIPIFNSATKPGVDSALTPSGGNLASTVNASVDPCRGNQLSKFIKVSVSAQHLWACQRQTVEFNTAVVTGVAAHPDTVTPTGTYYIFGKETNLTLSGTDSMGSWNDPVHYWMPFLQNQYGTYGLHDATWRKPDQFGHVSPSSNNGSQGCVELPLSSAQWLYNWVDVGTTVSVQS